MKKLILLMTACMAATTAQAGVVATQTAGQGSYPYNQLGSSSWSGFTSAVTANNSLVRLADFTSLSASSTYDAVFVNQEEGNTLSSGEISALTAFISSGKKAVFIGENDYWAAWNASLTQVTGGSLSNTCSSGYGVALVSNDLTAGVSSTYEVCGSQVTGGTELFSNGLASLFQVGAGQVLMVGDSNALDDNYLGQAYNSVFATNISAWLDTPLMQDVPEPGMIGLLGLGALALVRARRRKA